MPVQAIIELPDHLYRTLSAHGLSKEVISREARKLMAFTLKKPSAFFVKRIKLVDFYGWMYF